MSDRDISSIPSIFKEPKSNSTSKTILSPPNVPSMPSGALSNERSSTTTSRSKVNNTSVSLRRGSNDTNSGSLFSSNSGINLTEMMKRSSFGKFPINTTESSNDMLLKEIRELNQLKRDSVTSTAISDDNDDEPLPEPEPKRRNKRVFSCEQCRKLKTKCIYTAKIDSCERCHRLELQCTLTNSHLSNQHRNLPNERNETYQNSNNNEEINERLDDISDTINGKLDLILSRLGGSSSNIYRPTSSSSALSFDSEPGPIPLNNYFTNVNTAHESPLGLIKQIDSRLFKRKSKYDPFKKACDEFLKFYFDNEKLCLTLAKSFLETSHFWIIPGGITEIDRQYVINHPFITCVFVILAMCFDENYMYVEEQKQLYWLTTRLLSIALVTDPLTDHDLEAILYISLYNISRKPKQLEFDNWLISGMGLSNFLVSIDLKSIKKRSLSNEYNTIDMFHLRIFNSLLVCHLQNAIGSNKPIMLSMDFIKLHTMTLNYPNVTIGDQIKVCEIDLYLKLNRSIQGDVIYNVTKQDMVAHLSFPDIDAWKSEWSSVISKDESKMLLFAYNFSCIMLSRKLINENKFNESLNMKTCYKTAFQYSIETIEKIIELPTKIIRGSPSFSLAQIIYSCITLCSFMDYMETKEQKIISLNLISKLFWQLNHIGESKNDATDTLGKIIQSLVESADQKHNLSSGNTPIQQILYEQRTNSNISSVSHELNTNNSSETSPKLFDDVQFPDVMQFENFEDFFNDTFANFQKQIS